jgi:hypothetical protein
MACLDPAQRERLPEHSGDLIAVGTDAHAIDDPDGLVVDGSVRIAPVIGQTIEYRSEHVLEHDAGQIRANAAVDADMHMPLPGAVAGSEPVHDTRRF